MEAVNMVKSNYIHNSHNVSNLIYHIVCPTKYRRVVITKEADKSLKEICLGISLRYDWIIFLEIGADKDHVHFLVQSTPTHSPTEIVTTIKSITARQMFQEHPEVKKNLWGGNFWSEGYFVSTVGKNSSESTVANYVKNQGNSKDYVILHK